MADFEKHVFNVIIKQSAGVPIGAVYGRMLNGKRFALVKTKVVWYAVRLITEGSFAVEREAFKNEEEADKYIAHKKKELEKF